MNLTALRYVSEVARCGSITNAAKNLSVSQPNLSKILKELEIELGMELFIRSPKGVRITKNGKDFIAKARKAINEYKELEDEFLYHKQDTIAFDIAIPRASYITHAYIRFINALDKKHKMCMHYNETNSVATIDRVAEHSFELGIIRYEELYEDYFLSLLQLKKLSFELVMEFEYVVVLSKKHPLAKKEVLLYEDLHAFVEILHGDTVIPSLVNGHEEEQSDSERKIYIYERGSQFDLLASEEQTYMWVSPIPQEILDRYHLVQRRCEGKVRQVKDLMIYPKDTMISPLGREFANAIRQVVEELPVCM